MNIVKHLTAEELDIFLRSWLRPKHVKNWVKIEIALTRQLETRLQMRANVATAVCIYIYLSLNFGHVYDKSKLYMKL